MRRCAGHGSADAHTRRERQGKHQEGGATPNLFQATHGQNRARDPSDSSARYNDYALRAADGISRTNAAPPSERFSARRVPPSSVTIP